MNRISFMVMPHPLGHRRGRGHLVFTDSWVNVLQVPKALMRNPDFWIKYLVILPFPLYLWL